MNKMITAIFTISILIPSAHARRGGNKEVKIQACTEKAIGDTCSFIGKRGHEIEGICSEGRRDSATILCKSSKKRMDRSQLKNEQY